MRQSYLHIIARRCSLVATALVLCATALHAGQTIRFNTHPTSDPATPATIVAAQFYRYDADAASDDGTAVRYSLSYGPSGMRVDEGTGEVAWFASQPGSYAVAIRAELASDPTRGVTQEWMVVASMPSAPTVSINPLSFTAVCVGATISVEYTALGDFVPGNAFILQISDANGSFDNFLNIGSVVSTTSGTITVKLPGSIGLGSRYRVRVMASNPVFIGNDNGSDFAVVAYPHAQINAISGLLPLPTEDKVTLVGTPITFIDSLNLGASYLWNFGNGAIPATSDKHIPDPVMYSTRGTKDISLTVVSASGCSSTFTYRLRVVNTTPRINARAAIAYDGSITPAVAKRDTTMWVCPGGTYRTSDHPHLVTEVYAETGANVVIESNVDVVFLKSGASLNIVGAWSPVIVVHEPGASIQGGNSENTYKIPVPTLTFDYTEAPVSGCPSLAPYTKRIRDEIPRISGAQTETESAKEYWVRNGGTLESSGSGNTYMADPGAHVIATGDNCTVYLKGNATFEARGSRGHRIIHEMSAVIVNAGEGSGLFPSSGITYVNEGVSSGVQESAVAGDSRIAVMPNPATNRVEIRNESYQGMVSGIELHDALGRVVREEKVTLREGESMQLSLDGLASGIYYVRLHGTDGVTIVKKLLVR